MARKKDLVLVKKKKNSSSGFCNSSRQKGVSEEGKKPDI